MGVMDQIASALGQTDDVPNITLAEKLSKTGERQVASFRFVIQSQIQLSATSFDERVLKEWVKNNESF